MGYQQGLSGLAGAANHLDVIGNNIANANTVGYKQGRANFADMYANSVATSTNTQIGIGTRLTSVQQQFGQGTINTTKSSLDIAINGNGFFQMSNNGVTTYSRDGVFHRDKSGAIVDAQNRNLMGYAAGPGGAINTAATVPLQAPTTNIAPQATTKITGQFNLNSQDKVPAKTPFNAGDNTTYNYNSSIQVYDTLGGSQQVSMYFAKNAAGTSRPTRACRARRRRISAPSRSTHRAGSARRRRPQPASRRRASASSRSRSPMRRAAPIRKT